jgi:hypothetical protein
MRTPVAPLWEVLKPGDPIREKLTGNIYYVTSVCASRVNFDTGATDPEWVRCEDFRREFQIVSPEHEAFEEVAL